MNRRSLFKNLAIVAGGILILPSCSGDKAKASIELDKLDISAEQEKLLGDVADTIIPATDTPGAKALNIHLFVLKMMNDCYEKTDQEKFVSGMNQMNASAKKSFGASFSEGTVKQRQELLQSLEQKTASAEQAYFYEIMKDRTIQGYMNSKYVMTNLVIYELIPSKPYNGYAPA
ncbi:MAG: gluconate 2-dehydrogenase subunit 3 family protein [Flavitalea sp.]